MEQVKPHDASTSQSQKEKEKEGNCHFCHALGHWFKNYKLYLENLKKKKSSVTTALCIYVIEVNLSTSDS
ncbi:hypothetical protein Syun_006584 [Stephania yunnanensis]|uniref:Uncharacterized protein n=1 Tax=Stephania yunnanensis TaxID=152371 RepID=A0AAP0KWV9_9MAGN